MKYITALLIKFVLITAVLWFILGVQFEVSFANILITSLVLTGASFIIGDLYVLPKIGNIGASMVDLVLALAGVWAIGSILYAEPIPLGTASLLSAVGIAIGELLVHWYMKKQFITGEATMPGYYDRELQTEFSDELEPDTKKNNKKDQE
ncbi:YndM family protein [Virgibacillus necropolis]|uniref:YndM family protein n=1 Tax=Virgibacillus necropolis TaxID=163877 RepID=UPI00384A8A3F